MLTPKGIRWIWDLSVSPPTYIFSKHQASVLWSMNPTCWHVLAWGQGHLMAQNQKVQPVPIAYILASLVICYGKRSLRKTKQKNPKLWRESKITESPAPSLSRLLLRQLGIQSHQSVGSLQSVLFSDGVLLPLLLQTWWFYPPTKWSPPAPERERDLWIGHALNTEMQGLPKAVFKSCVFRMAVSSKPSWVPGPRSTFRSRNYWIHA